MTKPQKQPRQATVTARFFRAVALPKNPQNYWPDYQLEMVTFDGDRFIDKKLIGKPDSKQMIMAKLELLNDPDQQEYDEIPV